MVGVSGGLQQTTMASGSCCTSLAPIAVAAQSEETFAPITAGSCPNKRRDGQICLAVQQRENKINEGWFSGKS